MKPLFTKAQASAIGRAAERRIHARQKATPSPAERSADDGGLRVPSGRTPMTMWIATAIDQMRAAHGADT